MVNLGDNVYLTWQRLHGNKIVTIRQFFVGKGGDLLPTKKGISFAMKAYDELEKVLASLVLIGDGVTLEIPPSTPKEGMDIYGTIEALVKEIHTAFEMWKPGQKFDHSAAMAFAKSSKKAEALVLESNRVTLDQFCKIDFDKFFVDHSEAIKTGLAALYAN